MPASQAFFCPYDNMSNKLGPWPPSSWNTILYNLMVGIIDFRCILDWTSITTCSVERPYFQDFMSTLQT
jgi:hypothetical protein